MKKTLQNSRLWLLALSLIGLEAAAQNTISGQVKDAKGNAVEYAAVQLQGQPYGAMSDDNGNFKLEGIPDGSYTLTVGALGYARFSQAATVANKQNLSVAVVLREDKLGLEEVVVTGSVNPRSALTSSVSVSTLKPEIAQQSAPRSTAELLRSIPGIRSEASAGDGNTNITVRGVPMSTGGSKYLQLQEDGLPILQFGDIAFATADIFLRADNTIDRIEALRGGSASTLASNSPAGLINFISKTGETEGGSIATTIGVDFPSYRTDFEYGSPLGKGLSFHVGGFFRQGDGPRRTGFTSTYGGQIKANLTKRWSTGYSRMYFKYLNDRSPAYMPMPIKVTGTNSNPTWESVEGYSAVHGTLHSPTMLSNITLGGDGNIRRSSQTDGMNPITMAIGNETGLMLENDWKLTNRARMAWNRGRFVAPFTAQVGNANDLAASIAGDPSFSLTYADGSAFPANANGNGLLTRMHLFDVDLNNLNNFTNDLNLNKSFGNFNLSLGMYKAYQRISMSWLWNSYLTDVNDDHMRAVNLESNGQMFTQNGLLAYGVPFWGNCCNRNYDTDYDITAPYAALEFSVADALRFEASVRYDMGRVQGSYAGGDGQTTAVDMDGDGSISTIEQSVASINNALARQVNYTYNYLSYSVGANYMLTENLSLFARNSQGGRANADRLLFGPYILADGSAAADLQADMVSQTELGAKMRGEKWALNATAFLAMVQEQNYEATTQLSVNREYRALGLELDGVYSLGKLDLRGGLTFTDASIVKDAISPANEGNRPRRQAAFIYNFAPSYQIGKHAIGASVIGTTSSYAQDNNELIMPSYAYVNAFADFQIVPNLFFSLGVNNLLNTIGITESEEGSITENQVNYVRARSITGRSTTASLRFRF